MRRPPQGGLAPSTAPGEDVVEIACDESGFSGTNVLDPSTPVFTHASVDLSVGEAAGLVAELRARAGDRGGELKSSRVLRVPAAAEALLAALRGRALVVLVDKELFLATRLVDVLVAEPSATDGARLTVRPAALVLRRAGRARPREWAELLGAFVAPVRSARRRSADASSAVC